MAAEAEFWSFPTNPDEFDQDERISYSKLDNKYIAVQGDGTEYEFDDGLRRWIPMIDEALIEEQQRGYMFGDTNADADAECRCIAFGREWAPEKDLEFVVVVPGIGLICSRSSGTSVWPVRTL